MDNLIKALDAKQQELSANSTQDEVEEINKTFRFVKGEIYKAPTLFLQWQILLHLRNQYPNNKLLDICVKVGDNVICDVGLEDEKNAKISYYNNKK